MTRPRRWTPNKEMKRKVEIGARVDFWDVERECAGFLPLWSIKTLQESMWSREGTDTETCCSMPRDRDWEIVVPPIVHPITAGILISLY